MIRYEFKDGKGGMQQIKDHLAEALAYDGFVRAYAIQATNIVAEAQRRRDTWHASSAALGRTLVSNLLLGATLKRENKLAVRIQGDDPATGIVVNADEKGGVKDYIKSLHLSLPLNNEGKADVRGAVGAQGMFIVIKDLGLRKPFSGQTLIVSGRIAEDFTYYLAVSGQIPSAVGLGVLVNTDGSIETVGRFMVQIVPGADEEAINGIKEQLKTTPRISTLLDEGQTPEEILKRLLDTEELNVLEEMPVQFKCGCSKEEFMEAIIASGTEEIRIMMDEDYGAEAVCSFCNSEYKHGEEELAGLKKEVLEGI